MAAPSRHRQRRHCKSPLRVRVIFINDFKRACMPTCCLSGRQLKWLTSDSLSRHSHNRCASETPYPPRLSFLPQWLVTFCLLTKTPQSRRRVSYCAVRTE